MSADRDAEYFSDGMTEEIIGALSGIAPLRVAARTSSFAFKGKDTDIRQIGRELGVRTVLEGSVRQAGRRLRITAQLIDVASGYHLWSERFDREMEDVFAVQDEIARAIAETLHVRLVGPADAPGRRPSDAGRRGLQPVSEGPVLPQLAPPEAGHRGARGGDRPRLPLCGGLPRPRRGLLLLGLLRRYSDLGGLRPRALGGGPRAGAHAGHAGGASVARVHRALLRLGHGPRGARDSNGHRKDSAFDRRILLARPVPRMRGPGRGILRGDPAWPRPRAPQCQPPDPARLVLHVRAPLRGGGDGAAQGDGARSQCGFSGLVARHRLPGVGRVRRGDPGVRTQRRDLAGKLQPVHRPSRRRARPGGAARGRGASPRRARRTRGARVRSALRPGARPGPARPDRRGPRRPGAGLRGAQLPAVVPHPPPSFEPLRSTPRFKALAERLARTAPILGAVFRG